MDGEAALKEWIREHKVTWEMDAWKEMVEQRPTSVGFELRLFARHATDAHPSPGCDKCLRLYERLHEIAVGALPREHRPTTYEIEPFHAALHTRPESQWAWEVQLTIHIVHEDGYLRPLDECEKRCADEIQKNLRALGVQPKTWSVSRELASSV